VAVSSTGRVVSNLDVEIKCKASGQVITLPFDVSATVKKGDLLVELDPIDEQRRLQQAEVALASSEARLAQAQQELSVAEKTLATERKRAEAAVKSAQARARETDAKSERVKTLWEKKLTSEESYDTARTAAIGADADLTSAEIRVEEIRTEEQALELKRQNVRIAEGQVESNRIDLSIAKQRVQDTVVRAPMDGVIAARNVQIGQIISSGISNVGGGTTALVLSDLGRLFVLASVDESDIGKVELGQPARITADAFPGQDFRGEVVRIATRGVNTSNVVTFEGRTSRSSRPRRTTPCWSRARPWSAGAGSASSPCSSPTAPKRSGPWRSASATACRSRCSAGWPRATRSWCARAAPTAAGARAATRRGRDAWPSA
jgi:HlyD family secretion protein